MSRFRILQVDHFDPVKAGRDNRILFTIYGVLPTLFVLALNLGEFTKVSFAIRLIISFPVLLLCYFLLYRKIRANIKNLKTIGEIEIKQSGFRKIIGDSVTEINFASVKEITLTKHFPSTSMKESKSGFYSFIMKIIFYDDSEESIVISDRSIDLNQKISIIDTMKTLKKIVKFDIKIQT